MTELTDEAVKALLAHYELPTDCDCDDDDCVKCSHYPTFQERASKQLKAAAPDLARALLDARAERDRLAAELAAANAREAGLRALLINRDGGSHDEDCKARRYANSDGLCNCGHDEVVAALAQPSTEGGE